MKRSELFNQFIAHFVSVVLCLATVISCKDNLKPDPDPQPGEPKLTLAQNEIDATSDENVFFIEYSLENPVEGEHFTFDDTEDWLTIGSDEEAGRFIVQLTENISSQERSAIINGHYADIDFVISVRQDMKSAFKISVSDVKESSFILNVVPEDKDMTYLFTRVEHNQFSLYNTPEEYIRGYINSFAYMASLYGLSVPKYMEKLGLIRKGDIVDELVRNVVPGRTYHACCVGYDTQNDELISVVDDITFETVPIQYDETTFGLDIYISGPVVGLEVTPEDDQRRYMPGVVQVSGGGTPDPYDIVTTMQEQLYATYDKFVEEGGFSLVDVINGITYAGKDDFMWELQENQKYFAFAFAVDGNTGYINSTPNPIEVNTETIQPSDNVITIEISAIEQHQAHAKVTVTNEFDPYILGTIPVAQLEGLSDDEILAELTSGKYSLPQAKSGSRELDLTLLQANTEYYALAWGSVKMQPTTKLYKVKFTTLDIDAGKASLDLECDKFFDGDELLEQYPEIFEGMDISGKAVLPVTAIPSGEYEIFYHYVGKGKFTSVCTDDFLNNTMLPQYGSSEMHKYYVVDYGFTYKIAGNAFDKDGKPGRVFRKEIKTDESAVSPISEFTPFDESDPSTAPMMQSQGESLMIVLK